MQRISGFQFYNTSEFDLAELVNDADHIAANFKSYLQGFSANVLEILMSKERGLNFGEEIDKMDAWEGAQLNTAKEILAYELTKLVHGEEEAQKAQESARALFSQGNADNMPTTELEEADFQDGKIDILAVLVKSGQASSRSDARRAVTQGGVSVDGEKVTDITTTYAPADFDGEGKIVKKGKKNFRRVVAK